MTIPIYHEKQVRELCALHALNNLFQAKNAFTKYELDSICHNLSPDNWINPHKSVLGFGNYDINVIMKALQSRGCEAIWFDKRRDPQFLNLPNICGFICNIPSDYKISFITFPFNRRHWITVREINGLYYNLDSKLDSPQVIGAENDLKSFLKQVVETQDKEIFIVVSNDVYNNQSWLKETDTFNMGTLGSPESDLNSKNENL